MLSDFREKGLSLLTAATPHSPRSHLCLGTTAEACRDAGSASAEMIIALIRQRQPDKMCALQWFVSIMEKKEAGSDGNGTRGKNLPSPRQPAQHWPAETCPLLSTCRNTNCPCCTLSSPWPIPKSFLMEENSHPCLYSAVLLLISIWQLNWQV